MKGLYCIIERDDAVLIPDDGVAHADFRPVEVELAEGVTVADIDTDQVVLLEASDGTRLRFERCTPAAWAENYDRWEAAGWMPIGFEMIRWYDSYAAYAATLDE